ncbi:hypothetical protein V5O48_012042 [Marasmius crinis-equi]|uniref:CxC1-like cysteine cluster associated with KDZ transposases domain-containing protein n=1 Tax=Marasmius crinis-equi TaxID=585013 RepID=A0ABR3F421_9AGAR
MSRGRIPKHAKNILQDNDQNPSRSYSFHPTKRTSRGLEKHSLQSCIFIADGQTFTQDPHLPVQFGQVGFREFPLQNPPSQLPRVPRHQDSQEIELATGKGESDPIAPSDMCYETPELPSANTRKRAAQAARWEGDVIPQLLFPYMRLLRATNNFHDEPQPRGWVCTCPVIHKSRRRLEITVVRFYTLSKIFLDVCDCCPAALQLVEKGLFPCAPLHPTLAVDIRVLNFVNSLFVNIAPNYRAWCDTVTTFLKNQGYQMRGQDPLRRHFTNTLQWYNSLRHATKQFVDDILRRSHQVISSQTEACDNDPQYSSPPLYPPDSSPASSRSSSPVPPSNYREEYGCDYEEEPRKRPRSDDEEPQPQLASPSEYLHSRCPLCFGGNYSDRDQMMEFDTIVCIDAYFTQKHNKTKVARDPAKEHPDTVFVPEGDVKEMEDFVESVRGNNIPEPSDGEDGYDHGLKVPRSALNGCEASFTAADERRTKSSTQFFDSTALMALMCRHDHVLWLANMTSAGEKQHYVLSLIETLYKHLPPDFRVGVLYDIACQLHCSCVKWDFLEEQLDRLGFAVSVFHAFGHDWPCQLIYHPRKRTGFGLSDGEGCERFWHSISHLIPYLRVCRYHQRLYTLDTQIQHADKESMLKLGSWLCNKWGNAHGRLSEAERILDGLGLEDDYLREQWKEQIHEQTRPQPKQNKNQGKKAVEEVLALRENREILVQKVDELEDILMDLETPGYKRAEASLKLPQAREKLKNVEKRLRWKELLLGVHEDQRVQHLLNSLFLKHQMNALALKTRLIARLQARKFERDRLERSFRKQLNDQKLHSQISQSLKRREPGIQALARDYNSLVTTMEDLRKQNRAPANAVIPEKIPMDRLFTLDVDDSIWQDVGLTDKYDNSQPPAWLADDSVRTGIRAILERDRCIEEIQHLSQERNAMQQWFAEQWYVLITAIDQTTHPDVLFQLRQRRSEILALCWRWERSAGTIAILQHTPHWGPSDDEVQEAAFPTHVESLPVKSQELYSERVDLDAEYDSEESEDSCITDYDEADFNVVDTFEFLDSNSVPEV